MIGHINHGSGGRDVLFSVDPDFRAEDIHDKVSPGIGSLQDVFTLFLEISGRSGAHDPFLKLFQGWKGQIEFPDHRDVSYNFHVLASWDIFCSIEFIIPQSNWNTRKKTDIMQGRKGEGDKK
jgi:hypothetical protein